MRVTASILNVRSGPGIGFRVIDKLARDLIVDVKEGHGDWAWVSPGNGWVSRSYLEALRIARPQSLPGLLRTFGPPGSPEASSGRVRFPAPLKLGWSPASITVAACHIKMEEIFNTTFRYIHSQGLWTRIKTFDGIYNDRVTTGGTKKSTHAWGIAVDLNAGTNRYGTKGDMPPEIIDIFERHGFIHLKHDPMHFQYAEGY